MVGIIFVKRKNSVDTYQVNIDVNRIKSIQKSIDKYNGKGKKLEKNHWSRFFCR